MASTPTPTCSPKPPAFDAQLRALLDEAAADGVFSERLREITVAIWR